MELKNYLFGIIFIAGSFGMVSCSSEIKEEDEPVVTPEDPVEKITDLSEKGLANCYIVQASGEYKLKADNQFNLGESLPVPPQISPVTAGLVWQSDKGLIEDIELIETEGDLYIKFNVVKAEGNALLGVYNEKGDLEWSWHIWMPVEAPSSIPTATGYELMNMNLGALTNTPGSPSSYGLLYQWGRKDPFPAAGELTGDENTISATMYDIENNVITLTHSSWTDTHNNTLSYSISHPMEVLSNYSQYTSTRDWLKDGEGDDSLWGNPYGYLKDETTGEFINKGKKTCYDPSPLGWRVAPADVFRDFTSTGGYAWEFVDFNIADVNEDTFLDLEDYNYGWHFYVNPTTFLYFPAASRFDGSFAMLMGSMSGLWGNYWSNSPYEGIKGGAFCPLAFQVADQKGNPTISVTSSAGSSRADAFSIRCIRDN